LIYDQDFLGAIDFAKHKILPLIGEDGCRKALVERTMTLVAFDGQENFPYPDLLGNQRKIKISSMMNHALLRHKRVTTEPKLAKLIKLMKWMQTRLTEKMVFPFMNDVSLGNLTMKER
jgi:hypothetical protein